MSETPGRIVRLKAGCLNLDRFIACRHLAEGRGIVSMDAGEHFELGPEDMATLHARIDALASGPAAPGEGVTFRKLSAEELGGDAATGG